MSRVCVVGLGYMGLPMAAILARAGHDVVGVDINPTVVARVNEGVCPFAEPGMPELIKEAHASGRLKAITGFQDVRVSGSQDRSFAEIYILSLPTPVDHASHEADMSYVEAGARSIASVLVGGELVVLESTSLLGATRKNVVGVIEGLRPELAGKVDYVFCPERAIPGNTLKEMVGNDRLVGGLTSEAAARAVELYKTFCTGALLEATTEEAEMVKLVENASRDAQIAFANELSLVCDKLGLDVWNVIRLANHHPRVNILTPGPGVGGHCLAVDPWFIANAAPELTPLIHAVRGVNDGKPHWVVDKVKAAAGKGAKVACLGLAYKPDVDDLRESPSVTVVEELMKAGFDVRVVEPHLKQWNNVVLHGLEEAVEASEIVVTLTAHSVFKTLDRGLLEGKVLVDVVGMYR